MSEPSPADHEESPDAPASDSSSAAPPARPGRSKAVGFVVIFLVTTFGLLTAFQFMSQTVWMQRYLFTVAGHTAWALDWVTESSYLEVRDDGDLPMDRRAQIRAEIEAWPDGLEPPFLPRDARAEGPPLTRWEIFQHRTLSEKWDLEVEQTYMKDLANHVRPDGFDNPAHHIAFLVERVALLDAALFRASPDGRIRERGEPETIQLFREAREALERAASGPFTLTEESFRELLAIDEALETAWAQQLDFTGRRAAHIQLIVDNSGPMVHVVWDSGPEGALESARTRLTAVVLATHLTNAERASQAEQVRSEIQALERQLAELRRTNAPEESIQGRRFRFTIIPECGAIETMAIYIAAILGFPALWWKRLAGIVLGLPLLYAVNIFRLACLGLIGAWFQDERIFDFAHHYVWQAIYLVFVVVVWLLWMELLVRRGESSSPADA